MKVKLVLAQDHPGTSAATASWLRQPQRKTPFTLGPKLANMLEYSDW